MNSYEHTPNSTPVSANPKVGSTTLSPKGNFQTDKQKSEKLHAEIKKTWGELSDDDIRLHAQKPEQFFSKIEEKYGTRREEAQKRLADMRARCGCAPDDKAA